MTQHPEGSSTPWGPELPLVGRSDALAALLRPLRTAGDGHGQCVLLTGEPGVGKSRLVAALCEAARARQVLVASGSAYTVEAAVPYGAIADALARPLRDLEPTTLTVLARGAEHDLHTVVPGLAGRPSTALPDPESGSKAHLLWNVTQFLTRLAARSPLLLVLDNAHESDTSSLELLHFLVRNARTARIMVVLCCTDAGLESHATLSALARTLLTSGDATRLSLESLTPDDLAELLARAFALDGESARRHAETLWSHTRGNPFFIEESLKALVAAGHIRQTGAGWVVESVLPTSLPASIRDGVRARLDTLPPPARRLIEIAAIAESRIALPVLDALSQLDAGAIADAIDLLCERRLLVEHRSDGGTGYEFGHPIIQATVRSTLTAARERALHAAMASALEAHHGARSVAHAAEIARHLVRGTDVRNDPRALHYLTAAGEDALGRRANAEALRWLEEAVLLADAAQGATDALLEALATARSRAGDRPGAAALRDRALAQARARRDAASEARLLLVMAQDAARAGEVSIGLTLLAEAETAAQRGRLRDAIVRVAIARAKMLQAIGRHQDALRTISSILPVADALGNTALLARTHQTLLQLYAWTGPSGLAREHGARAIALADASGDREVAWAAHWAMAMLEGFTGAADGVAVHIRQAAAHADALGSPTLQAMTAEIEIEHASGVGRWDEALAIAERTIPLARAIMPQALLPRLLVWTGLILLERDESAQATELLTEAWQLAGADDTAAPAIDNVHNAILAHTGMGTLAMSRADWPEAIAYGERGLALADRFGYVAWAIHRLIPMLIEATLRTQDFARVEVLTARLRAQSEPLGHRLGLAWATAAEALVARVRHHAPDAAARLLAAAVELEAVPFVFHAARLRRNAAQVLEADGEIEAASRELRLAHDVFVRLGAEFELRGVRTQLRSIGVRLPPRTTTTGAEALTGRELEIARAVARRLTNKEIGASLDISARTVSTHLSNIFAKLGVDSRGALADLLRERDLLGAD